MDLIIWIISILIIFFSEHFLTSREQSRQKQRIVSNKVLEENIATANQYEIAFLKGGAPEVFKLAFYTLVKSGYLIKGKGAVIDDEYHLDKNKNLEVLNDIEKAMAMAYEDSKLLSTDLQKKVKAIFEGYDGKIKSLYLKQSDAGCVRGCLPTIVLFLGPIVMYGLFRNKQNMFIMMAMSITIFIIMKKEFLIPAEISSSGQRYIALFEKNHFPYPNIDNLVIGKKIDFGEYIGIITPCSLQMSRKLNMQLSWNG